MRRERMRMERGRNDFFVPEELKVALFLRQQSRWVAAECWKEGRRKALTDDLEVKTREEALLRIQEMEEIIKKGLDALRIELQLMLGAAMTSPYIYMEHLMEELVFLEDFERGLNEDEHTVH